MSLNYEKGDRVLIKVWDNPDIPFIAGTVVKQCRKSATRGIQLTIRGDNGETYRRFTDRVWHYQDVLAEGLL